VLTERQKTDIVNAYGLENVTVIPHAVEGEGTPPGKEYEPFNIVYAGRFAPEKDPGKALDALKAVLQTVPQAVLHFYGDGPLEMEVKRRAFLEKLSKSVVFHGHCSNMNAVFASAACCVLTSQREGFSLVIQESMLCGCPVVSFDCNYGPSAMIEDGVNGYLVPRGDTEAMARGIVRILRSPELRATLSENARTSIQRFSKQAVADCWRRELDRLLAKRDSANGDRHVP